MFSKGKMTKQEKQKQSFLFASNALADKIKESGKKVFFVGSTLSNEPLKEKIFRKLLSNIAKTASKKILFITTCEDAVSSKETNKSSSSPRYKEYALQNFTRDRLKSTLNKKSAEYDLVFVDLPSINVFSNALECAKLCDGAILLEKYSYITYKEFEQILYHLKECAIPVVGVITY